MHFNVITMHFNGSNSDQNCDIYDADTCDVRDANDISVAGV